MLKHSAVSMCPNGVTQHTWLSIVIECLVWPSPPNRHGTCDVVSMIRAVRHAKTYSVLNK